MFLKKVVGFGVLLLCTISAAGQSTEFTYQGRLTDGSLPATAIYDFEFRLFSVEAGGSVIASVSRPGVSVSTGIFSVKLDFAGNFDGTPRWLEIALKPTAASNFTTLAPRQPITSAPHAIRSLNSTTADTSTNSLQLGGLAANQYVVTSDPRMVDARVPVAGSADYIQNSAVQQASSNFNVSGNGTVGGTLTATAVTSSTHFNIGFNRALALGTSTSVFAGRNAGISNTTGSGNSFFGDSAGRFNTSASNNSFVGRDSGLNNTGGNNSFFGAFTATGNISGSNNSFFGVQSGEATTTGNNNSFYGRSAGASNTDGDSNAFFGFEAGMSNTIADGNSFFGARAGRLNTALFNSFFGSEAGAANTTGERNSLFGYWAGRTNTAANNSFFGSLAGSSNTTGAANTFVGESAGEDNTTGARNTFIGRWSGNGNTTGADNVFVGFNSGLLNTTGTKNVFIGLFAGSFDNGDNLTLIGSNAGVPNGLTLQYATAIGADAEVSTSNTVQLGRTNGFDTVYVPGLIRVGGLGVAGSTDVCRNASNILSTCSSSLLYKSDVRSFARGLDVVRQLKPITFRWGNSGLLDIGFGAEDVDAVEPLLATRNSSGDIEGVKYKQITTVLVNAINEQQEQIEKQATEIQRQRSTIDSLRKIICRLEPNAEVCKEVQ